MDEDLQDDPQEDRDEAPEEEGDYPEQNEALLQEIRDNYAYALEYWTEAREERKIDMRYLQGDPWDEDDRKARKEAGRPCISHDELNQYVNQCVNSARQSKRGIKVEPRGNGASDKSAEFRQNLIRAIEYRSLAPSIYVRAFQDVVEGGYGFCRISRRYVSEDSDEQEIVVRPIANPDSVLYSPDFSEPDWSDAPWAFVIDHMPRAEFKRRFPRAQIVDFGREELETAPQWITDKSVLVAEYWKLEQRDTGKKTPKGRRIVKTQLVQYMTNGVEILEKTEQPGREIPLPAFIGQERWINDGAGAKRKLGSLVRLARDPQMSYAYLCSQQMEEAGLSPKTPYVGYTDQFETDKDAWDTATKQPHAYLQADPVVDAATGQVLPLPRREPFTPNFVAYEAAKESCRRAIQAAMGISPLPTSAQRQNEKSGVALDRIQTAEAIGSYHFHDGFDRAVTRAGRIIESWIKPTYDTERDLPLRKPDDSHKMVRINTDAPYPDPETQEPVQYVIGDAEHDTTVSTGPSYDSQRREVSEFLDTLIGSLPKLPVSPPQAAKLLSMAIRMKQLGPKGDEMAEIISPEKPGAAEQAGQQLAAAQQQLQAAQQLIAELQAELQKLAMEKQAKVVDNEYRMALEQMKIEADTAKAEILTKAQNLEERTKFLEDLWKQLHSQAHEVGLQAADQAHTEQMAAQQQQPVAATDGQQAQADQPQPLPQAA